MAFGQQKMSWGDLGEEDVMIPPTRITGPDKNGIKTIVSYKVEDGKRYRVTKQVREYTKTTRVAKRVAERRKNFTKFGDCEGLPPGPEDGITSVSFDEVCLETPDMKTKDDQEETLTSLLSWAKGRSWRFKNDKNAAETVSAGGEGGERNENAYVAPHMRGTGREGSAMREQTNSFRDEGHTLRVTNISEDTKEADLQDLFRPFGRISRIYLAKDRVTMASRGFAFVTYLLKEDAESAKAKLNGYGYDHLILKLEWAQPSKPKEGGETTFRSGYGKALPQGL